MFHLPYSNTFIFILIFILFWVFHAIMYYLYRVWVYEEREDISNSLENLEKNLLMNTESNLRHVRSLISCFQGDLARLAKDNHWVLTRKIQLSTQQLEKQLSDIKKALEKS